MANKDFGQVIKESDPDTLRFGAKQFGTDAVQITATATKLGQGVWIKALAGNSNTVYVGSSSAVVSSSGYPLAAGAELFVPINDLSKVWLIGGASDQEIRYVAS
jgi:hypothetical protein